MDYFEEIKRDAEQLLRSDRLKGFVSGVQDAVDEDVVDEELEAGKQLVSHYMDNPELDPADGIEDLIDEE